MDSETQCPHERGDVPHGQYVSDHEPLTREQVSELLTWADHLAREPGDVTWSLLRIAQSIAKTQVRLVRAVPGMGCPRPTDGPAAARMAELERLYVDAVTTSRHGGEPVTAKLDAICCLLGIAS